MKQKNVILMVVAVGCGLVAAFLTSQMSARGQVEQVDVVVAAKDLPVGTVFTKEEVKNLVKIKKVPKDGLPPSFITNPEELADKRLSRPIRAEETFNPADLNKGIALPEGTDLVALSVGPASAASGFVVPGCRVDVMASLKLGNTLKVFDLLVNTLVINVNHDMTNNKEGVYPNINQVGFALTKKEAVLLELARARNCNLTLKLRNTTKTLEADKEYNIDDVIKLLEDSQNPTVVKAGTNEKRPEEAGKPVDPVKPVDPPSTPAKPVDPPAGMGKPIEPPVGPVDPPVKPVDPTPSAPAPSIAVKKVLIAKRDIDPHTDVTNDLIAEAFELKDAPKEFAGEALSDLSEALGKQFKVGVAKNSWVTPSMLGLEPKPKPQDHFVAPKPEVPTPAVPAEVKPVVKRKTHDVAVHGTNGTVIHRYEEVAPGQWKKIAELTPEQAARDPKDEKPQAPQAPQAAPKAD